ncbi:transcription initiation factor IID, subunit [Opisthorchis viverrini]|uniref:Transcription initiation factor TFIID subunit 13 n=1 Tax=Opisthorchis viverrini TaxID=6198 RepID=A0A1S8X352_OPIVI|nr:transcription initiation factor IID, subunit [Opisthorchis viverrini]
MTKKRIHPETEPGNECSHGKVRRPCVSLWFLPVRSMLYAFGDVENPLPETVAVLEEVAVKHIIQMTRKALKVGRSGKISVDDMLYLVRRDPKKFSRVKELLLLSEELRRARKAFEEDEFGVLK